MNIQGYAMIQAAYLNPSAYGDLTGLNGWVWRLSHLLADQKFVTIFSMLFGMALFKWGAPLVSLGYIGTVMLICKADSFNPDPAIGFGMWWFARRSGSARPRLAC